MNYVFVCALRNMECALQCIYEPTVGEIYAICMYVCFVCMYVCYVCMYMYVLKI